MLRISLRYVLQVFSEFDPLAALVEENGPRANIWFTLYGAQEQLEALTTTSIYAPYLRSSFQLSQELLTALRVETAADLDAHPNITQFAIWNIKHIWGRYRVALIADLGALDAFFVVQQGGYAIPTLTLAGELLFPSDLLSKVPGTLFDAREAGKRLAYAVPTSAGFHIFRVLEGVLRKYYFVVTNGAAPPKVRSIGVYLNALKMAKKGYPIVLAALKQIADLHRNPLIHPEQF